MDATTIACPLPPTKKGDFPKQKSVLTISSGGFLVLLKPGGKLLELVAPDDAVQVHLLQDAIGR